MEVYLPLTPSGFLNAFGLDTHWEYARREEPDLIKDMIGIQGVLATCQTHYRRSNGMHTRKVVVPIALHS